MPFAPNDDHNARNGPHWKTRRIVGQTAELPFVWIADEIATIDAWLKAN